MIRSLMVMVALLCAGCVQHHDDSDMPDGRVSGFEVFTDNLTGCQYIGFGTQFSGKTLTPRIAADGISHQGCHQAGKP